jgi:hypothetical protein
MANVFFWTPQILEAVLELRAHAEKPENWYRPNNGAVAPGNNQRFVVWAGTTRAVFTWTVAPFGVLRHLSVSVRGEGRYPMPMVVYTLAHHFGFTGATVDEGGFAEQPGPWQEAIDKDVDERCHVVQELVQPDPQDTMS